MFLFLISFTNCIISQHNGFLKKTCPTQLVTLQVRPLPLRPNVPSGVGDGHHEVAVEDRGVQVRAADGHGDPGEDGHQTARHEGRP